MMLNRQNDAVGITKGYKKDNLRFLYPDDYHQFFSVVPNMKHAFELEFLFQTGMRIGEAQTVKIEDIDFTRLLISDRTSSSSFTLFH